MSYPVTTIGDMGCACQRGDSMGDVLPRVLYPSEVDADVNATALRFDAVNADVAACAGLTAADKAAWANVYAQWKAFRPAKPLTPAGALVFVNPMFLPALLAQMQDRAATLDAFKNTLRGWQDKLAETGCKPSGPLQPTVTPAEPFDANGAIKWGAAAIIAAAIAYALHKVL